MSNVSKKGVTLPPIFQADKRPVAPVTIEELNVAGENFESYTPNEGDKVQFFNLEETLADLKKQPVRVGSKGFIYLVPCMYVRKGEKDPVAGWFNLNSLNKQDINRVAVNPSWYALGNYGARLKGLIEMGEITRLADKSIMVGEFDSTTNRNKVVPTLDPVTGQQKIDSDGTAMFHTLQKEQKAIVYTPYAPTAKK